MKDIYNNPITEKELENALKEYANNNSFEYYHEVLVTAMFLNSKNEWKHNVYGEYWFIPRALIPIAFEAWWILQHNIDSYGCDYEWVFSNDGMDDLLFQDPEYNLFWWGETEEDFVDYFNL